jgi:hypothetical protein
MLWRSCLCSLQNEINSINYKPVYGDKHILSI